MPEQWKINWVIVNRPMQWEERDTQRGENSGGYFVPLLKNESNSPSSPLAPSLFPANLSAALLSDGFAGGGRDGREEKNRCRTPHSQAKPLPC